jgi:hypothetical protein
VTATHWTVTRKDVATRNDAARVPVRPADWLGGHCKCLAQNAPKLLLRFPKLLK